ncbi:flagellar export chaperone FlgN [Saccharospirillum mangrovi]|uniref:flagellar export chaperone FlgN n=1 Tax=Saccharospirillum mangrovi TaxID=2161747 RepID=UPI000D33D5D7|nr:flagellar export chaperone FlgN [Saccharospirillum mangrovi]
MTIDNSTLTRLDAALRDAQAASDAFKPLLEEELAALKSADIQALQALVQRKRKQTEDLLNASQNLLQWCAEQDIDPDFASFQNWTTDLAENDRPAWQARWKELRQSLTVNDQHSAVNRQVLATLSSRKQAQMSILRNLLAPTQTYSADGQSDTRQPSGWVDRV